MKKELPLKVENLLALYKLGINTRLKYGDQVLTTTQALVVCLLGMGMSQKKTCSVIGISLHTIDKHSCNLYKILRVRSAVGFAHFAIAQGLLQPGEYCGE